jgi:hypothetical protein
MQGPDTRRAGPEEATQSGEQSEEMKGG